MNISTAATVYGILLCFAMALGFLVKFIINTFIIEPPSLRIALRISALAIITIAVLDYVLGGFYFSVLKALGFFGLMLGCMIEDVLFFQPRKRPPRLRG